MRQKISIQVLALLLAVLTFTASVGLAVDIHFCKNTIKNVSFFGTAENCMATLNNNGSGVCVNPSKATQASNLPQVSKTPCCSNHTFFSKVDITAQHQTADQQHSTLSIIAAVIPSTMGVAIYSIGALNNIGHYSKSPPLSQDFGVLYQTFRI
ncbi:MAG: hypothetical protein F9K23_04100 [Bacteroidetes bacterium]|nr:MAG: hypothetical protein F9K23_04100 [Bacteroidota bacterium]